MAFTWQQCQLGSGFEGAPLDRKAAGLLVCRKARHFSPVISSNLAFARGSYLVSRRMPARNQSQLLRQVCSNVAWAQGSNLRSQNSFRIGAGFFSRMPTSPFANEVRCVASICRATLSLPCLVDSRITCPFHMNLYQ